MIQMRDPSANTHIFILGRDFDKASKPPAQRGHRCELSHLCSARNRGRDRGLMLPTAW